MNYDINELIKDIILRRISDDASGVVEFLKKLPSGRVLYFIDFLESLPPIARLEAWKELVDFFATSGRRDASKLSSSIAVYVKNNEFSSQWKYTPPRLKKMGARLYLASGFKPESVGVTSEQLFRALNNHGISRRDLELALELRCVTNSKIKSVFKKSLKKAGWRLKGLGYGLDSEKSIDGRLYQLRCDPSGNWPGFTYYMDVSDASGQIWKGISYERLFGISGSDESWDMFTEDNLEESGELFSCVLSEIIKLVEEVANGGKI